jgi:chromosome segregation ATPase
LKPELLSDTDGNKDDQTVTSPAVHKRPVEEGNNLVEALLKHNRVLDESLHKLDEKNVKSEEKISELENTVAELKKKSKSFDEEIAKLEQKNSSVDDDTTAEIQKYLGIYERLKLDEKLFKVSCSEELERLQEEFEAINQGLNFNNVLIVKFG